MPLGEDYHRAVKIFEEWDVSARGEIDVEHLKAVLRHINSEFFTEKTLSFCCLGQQKGKVQYKPLLTYLYDPGDVDETNEKLGKMVGRQGISRIIGKFGPGGFAELNEFMASDAPCPKKTIYAQDRHDPIDAMDFWNINGAKVYTYSGLDVIEKHDQTTATGVLMLDRYAIVERVGDPASPFTWWPYQAFYVIPKGVNFAMCKAVGSSGANAAEVHPEETKTICCGLGALAEVAASEGKTRLFITGDCGYYALAVEAYITILTSMGWVRKDDAAFCAPSFRVNDNIDVFLCLGTTQMISTPDPTKNIVSRMNDAVVIYGTADLRGWYGGDVLDQLNKEYPSPEKMTGIVRANEGMMWGWILAYCTADELPGIWSDIGSILVEFVDGSMHFMIGAFIAYMSKPAMKKSYAEMTLADWTDFCLEHWYAIPKSKELLDELSVDPTPFREFVGPGMLELLRKLVKDGIVQATHSKEQLNTMTWKEVSFSELLAVQTYMLGMRQDALKLSPSKQLDLFADRFRKAIADIKAFDEGGVDLPSKGNELTIGPRYIDWYCKFNLHLNKTILKDAYQQKKVGHAIDSEFVFLLDLYGRFANEVRSQVVDKPVVYHLECTELFSFTDFVQQQCVPVIDNPNYMKIASLSTANPLEFKRYSGTKAAAAMLFTDGKWYRDSDLPLRTPNYDGSEYNQHKRFMFPEGLKTFCHEEWDKMHKTNCHFGEKAMGFGRGEFLYVGSTELTEKYTGLNFTFSEDSLKGSVQYK